MADYKTNEHGIIISPGKFEGEPIWVPHFWEIVLNGDCEEYYEGENEERLISRIYISPEDIEKFPELSGHVFVELWESENGFVFSDLE